VAHLTETFTMQWTSALPRILPRHLPPNDPQVQKTHDATCDDTVATRSLELARFGRAVGATSVMREIFSVLERVAPTDLAVLFEGETGTGKALLADGVHRASLRANEVFLTIDCRVPPDDLARELAQAEGGTVFLDEVAALSIEQQARLLRSLEERDARVANGDLHAPDLRVLAATSRNLTREVADGRFRQDLLYRLSTVTIKLPPLRERAADLPLLIETVRGELNRRRIAQGHAPYAPLDARALELLTRHDFPGNVRELRNLVERIAVLGAAPHDLLESRRSPSSRPEARPEVRTDLSFHEAKGSWNDLFEKTYLTGLLASRNGNVSAAARDAGIDRRHLQRLMIKHSLRARWDDDPAGPIDLAR
jgi:DNA-binding NtrC family response regulator